jgi:Tfp pilus assembly protein PilO
VLRTLRGSWRTPGGIGLIGGAAIAMTVHAYGIKPRVTRVEAQAHVLETTRHELATARRAAAQLSGVEQVVTSMNRRRAILQTAAASEQEATDLLRDLQALGEGRDLRVTAFKPAAPVRRDSLVQWSVAVELEGSYAGVLRFLRDVAEYPRLVVVSGLRVRAANRDRPDVSLTASGRLSTFVPGPAPDVPDGPDAPSPAPVAGRSAREEPLP